MKTRHLLYSLASISILATTPTLANEEQPTIGKPKSEHTHKRSRRHHHGGYYESIKNPDFGSDFEKHSKYRVGDGYYGYLTPGNDGLTKVDEEFNEFAQHSSPQAPPVVPNNPATEPQSLSSSPTPVSVEQTAQRSPQNSELSTLEQKIFSTEYGNDSETARLDRLEQFVFGSAKSGQSAERIATLVKSLQGQPLVTKKIVDTAPAPQRLSLQDLMKQGRDEFRQSAYRAASESFERATEKSPLDQDAHFWLAMAYWKLYDYENTKSQLEIAFRINPFSTEGQAAKSQMLRLAPYLGGQRTPPVDPPSIVRQAIDSTRQQSGSLQQQKLDDGEVTAGYRIDQALLRAEKIMQDTNEYVRSAQADARRHRYRPSNLQEVSDMGYIRSNYARTDGFRQAALARIDATRRATSVQEWENHVLSRLGENPRAGKPRLRAFGTNLYTQYFGDEDAENPRQVAPADPPLQAKTLSYPSNRVISETIRQNPSGK